MGAKIVQPHLSFSQITLKKYKISSKSVIFFMGVVGPQYFSKISLASEGIKPVLLRRSSSSSIMRAKKCSDDTEQGIYEQERLLTRVKRRRRRRWSVDRVVVQLQSQL
jgi:hypothetical protein